MRILLTEDDEIQAQILSKALTAKNYTLDVASDGEEGWDYAQTVTYDLIVLDVDLPKLNGIELCRRLRANKYNGAILLLTSKGESSDKVIGLDSGADDYLVKPCTTEELFARIRALLRRQQGSGEPIIIRGDISLDPSSCEVKYKDKLLSLSAKEYSLLELFIRNPQRVFSSGAIIEHLWSFEDPPGEDTVRAHVKRLRQKLKAAGAADIIETIYGIGYRLKSNLDSPPEKNSSTSCLSETEKKEKTTKIQEAVSGVWEQLKSIVFQRISILEEAIASLEKGELSETSRAFAEQSAHKLAGSLGMFGFPEGSRISKELEYSFKKPGKVEDIKLMLTSLQEELKKPPQIAPSAMSNTSSMEPTNLKKKKKPVLLMVDSDILLTQQLLEMSVNREMEVKIAHNPKQAKQLLTESVPDVVLLELDFPDAPGQGLILLEHLRNKFPHLPVLVYSSNKEIETRLDLVNKGSYSFLSKSLGLSQVLLAIDDLWRKKSSVEVKILAVDDDPLLRNSLSLCLQSKGISFTSIGDPRHFWKALEETQPDLLILDLEMPYINGIEICQAVRNDSSWNRLPILFLTSNQDRETVNRLYNVGTDDYLSKPFIESDLITRIFNRLKRNQVLKSYVN